MGMAASQARLLNLTARKTNIEYEGQQINQQRTNLSNSSATYYNEMLQLTVPTPPSTDSYKTLLYTAKLPHVGESCTFNQITGADSSATINYTYSKEVQAIISTGSANVTKSGSNYTYNNNAMYAINDASSPVKASSAQILADMKTGTGISTLTEADIYVGTYGTGENIQYKYFLKSQLPTSDETKSVPSYGYGTVDKYYNETITGAVITRDSNNRIAAVSYRKDNIDYSSVSVTATQVTDEDAYEDAYNEYEYQTYLYEQKMSDINAQTSIIQAKDKQLELRLKQLDTEQSAISTELESVKSVCDKNVEDTFKTFA